jgi:dipeptidyl aminopeptidase/acylaminoacyl peptidase
VVVAFHGGPESQARPGFSVGAQMFVDAGFVFAEPNVRGSDGYGKTWLHADDGPKRLAIVSDIEDAAIWARTAFAAGGKAPKVVKNTAPYRRLLRISEYGDPERDAEALAKLSPMTYVARVKAPLLILQGASDPRVPAGEAIQIHDAIERRGVPCELMIFPDEGHGAQKRENRVLMLGNAIGFLRDKLGGP